MHSSELGRDACARRGGARGWSPAMRAVVVTLLLAFSPVGWGTETHRRRRAPCDDRCGGPTALATDLFNDGFERHSRTILQSEDVDALLLAAARDGDDEDVKRLLKEGANIEARDLDRFTPLMWASTQGHDEVVKTLLEHNADVNATSTQGYSALSESSFAGHASVVVILIEAGAHINQQDKAGCTPLHAAVRQDKAGVAMILLQNGVDVDTSNKLTGDTALTLASRHGRLVILEGLLKHDANVSARTHSGASALHLASSGDDWEPIMQALLDAGADINAQDNNGDTPLEYAAWIGNNEAVRWLLDRGADSTILDNDGQPAWVNVCRCENPEVVFERPCRPGACRNDTEDEELKVLLGMQAG